MIVVRNTHMSFFYYFLISSVLHFISSAFNECGTINAHGNGSVSFSLYLHFLFPFYRLGFSYIYRYNFLQYFILIISPGGPHLRFLSTHVKAKTKLFTTNHVILCKLSCMLNMVMLR